MVKKNHKNSKILVNLSYSSQKLKFSTILLPYKLFSCEGNKCQKLKFFYQFCCQYPLINYLAQVRPVLIRIALLKALLPPRPLRKKNLRKKRRNKRKKRVTKKSRRNVKRKIIPVNMTMMTVIDPQLERPGRPWKGTVHILRKHFYSTKLNLIT